LFCLVFICLGLVWFGSPGWPHTYGLPPSAPKDWNYRHAPPSLAYFWTLYKRLYISNIWDFLSP
jgi:hypothetical protein